MGCTGSYPKSITEIPEIGNHLAIQNQKCEASVTIAREIVTLPTHAFVIKKDVSTICHSLQMIVLRQACNLDYTRISLIFRWMPQSWDLLVKANQTDSIFLQLSLDTDMVEEFWFRSTNSRFITAEEDDRVVGFAPLMLDHRGCIRFIGDTNADYLDFVVPEQQEQILRGFFELLHQYRSDWSSIELKNIPGSSSILDLMPIRLQEDQLDILEQVFH